MASEAPRRRVREPRLRAEVVLAIRAVVRADRAPECGLRDRAVESGTEIGFAIELDEDVADDVLPERQAPVAGAAVRGELERHRQASLSREIASALIQLDARQVLDRPRRCVRSNF